MSQTPTINQYLLDLLVNSQLTAAQKTKDPKAIALAEKKYKDLQESEVTFGKFVRDDKTGKYSVKLVAKSRGWTIEKMVFNTGTIAALSRQKQQGAAQISALDLVTVPGLIYVAENDAHYLAVEKDSNIFEGLKLTGYEFPADSFVPTIYGDVEAETKTYGHVDLNHPIVTGRYRIYYINQNKKKDEVTDQPETTTVKLDSTGDSQVSSDNQNQAPESNEGDQANPGSTQQELKTPAEPGQSDNGPEGQSNSAEGQQDPADVAAENQQIAKENEAEQKEQLSSGSKKNK